MFENVVFARIPQPVAHHGQGIFLRCGCVLQCPAVITQRFHLQAATVQQVLQAGFDVVVTVKTVTLFAARQAGINRQGNSAACGILV